MTIRVLLAALIVVAPTSAAGRDCGRGTIQTDFWRFHSAEFAGRLALAPWARNSEEAKNAKLYCVLNDEEPQVKRRLDRIYFVLNNIVTSDPENAETAFIGLEVRANVSAKSPSLNMRREGDRWERRPIDEMYPVRQLRDFSWNPTTTFDSENEFAKKFQASVHGAVLPKAGSVPRSTWDLWNRLEYVNSAASSDSLGYSITAVWVSFDQRTKPALSWRSRVATEIRVGNASEVEAHLIGSNGEIPEFRYRIVFQ